ncbi:MAG: DUF6722 family protein [Segatella copri]
MIEELGKWLLDIAKYIVTAYVLVRMFGNDDGSIWTLIGAVFFCSSYVWDRVISYQTK